MRDRSRLLTLGVALGTGIWVLAGCGSDTPRLGPVDGLDLPPTDLERITVGSEAPDFTLRSFTGDLVTLSDFRGRRNVVLVFYRGHW